MRKTLCLSAASAALILAIAFAAEPAGAAASAAAGYQPPAKRVDPSVGILETRKSTMPTPRRPDGKVDFSGNWNGNFPLTPFGPYGRRRVETFEADQATMQRASGWNKPHYKPEYWQKVHELDFSVVEVDPEYLCGETGVPRLGAPTKITQTDKEIWLVHGGEALRIVPIDGRPRPEEHFDNASANGSSLGRWEGDTLVIESVGFDDTTWIRWQGYFHTDQMKVTERLRREGDVLFWNATIEDPEVLVEPWTTDTYVRRLNTSPTYQWEPAPPCVPSDPLLLVDRYYRG